MTFDEFNKHWSGLSDKNRKKRLIRGFYIFKKIADKQLDNFEIFIKKEGLQNDFDIYYFFNVVKSFWEDSFFSISLLKKKKFYHYAIYPVRTMMEKIIKLIYFTKNEAKRKEIIKKELLLACVTNYKMSVLNGESGDKFRLQYDELNLQKEYCPIYEVKIEQLRAFPNYETLCRGAVSILMGGEEGDGDRLYNIYRYLSGLPHGNIISIKMKDHKNDKKFTRDFLLMMRFCEETIKLMDYHMERKFTKEVNDAIKKVEKIIFSP